MTPSAVRLGLLTLLASVPSLGVAVSTAAAAHTESNGPNARAAPWRIEGEIDPTNTPVVAGDFKSLSASIAPTQAPIMELIDAIEAAPGAEVVVAILDSGFDLGHPALADRWTTARYDACAADGDPTDLGNGVDDDGDGTVDLGVGHGTFVASLVARVATGCRLMPVRIADDEGRGTALSFSSGMTYAMNHGANVINVSFALDARKSIVTSALAEAESRGIVVVCAAGNGSTDVMDALAATPTAVAVGAVDDADILAPFSNYGRGVRLYAPGVDIQGAYGSTTDGNLAVWSGTSFSAGFVSGVVALVRQRHPTWTPAEMRAALYASVDPAYTPLGSPMAGGRINVLKAAQR